MWRETAGGTGVLGIVAQVLSEIVFDGPIEPVFALVTTTKYWPEWHPATIGVAGAIEGPLRLGDTVRERAELGGKVYEGMWTVVDREPPLRLELRGESGRIAIAYTFISQGERTQFRRELTFDPANFGASTPETVDEVIDLMDRQSAAALSKLKRLVEHLLANESARLPE